MRDRAASTSGARAFRHALAPVGKLLSNSGFPFLTKEGGGCQLASSAFEHEDDALEAPCLFGRMSARIRYRVWDAPTRISFGKIYADALNQPEIEQEFDKLTEQSDSTLY